MAELGRMLGGRGQRAKSPASPLPTSNPFSEAIRTSPETDRVLPHASRPTAVQRLSSIWVVPGLSSSGGNSLKSTASRLQESTVNLSQPVDEKTLAKPPPKDGSSLFKEQDRTWHSPSPTQLIEKLLCVLMEAPIGTSLPARYNSHVMHLIEGYRNQVDQLETANSRIQTLKDSRARWLDSYAKIGAMWDDREKKYKAEIKRLEKLLVAQDPARSMEVVALARSKSLVDRTGSARFQEAVRSLAAQLEEDVVDKALRADGADGADDEMRSPIVRVDGKGEQRVSSFGHRQRRDCDNSRWPLILDHENDFLLSQYLRRRGHVTDIGYPLGPFPLAKGGTRPLDDEILATQERARMEAQARAHARERESNRRSEILEREARPWPSNTEGGEQQVEQELHRLVGDIQQASKLIVPDSSSEKPRRAGARARDRNRAQQGLRGPIDSSTSSTSSESSTRGGRLGGTGLATKHSEAKTQARRDHLERTVPDQYSQYRDNQSRRVRDSHVARDKALPPLEPVPSNSSRAFSFTAGDDSVDPFTPPTRAPAETSTVLVTSGLNTTTDVPTHRARTSVATVLTSPISIVPPATDISPSSCS